LRDRLSAARPAISRTGPARDDIQHYPKAGVDRDGSSLTNYYDDVVIFRLHLALDLSLWHRDYRLSPAQRSAKHTMRVSPEFFLHSWARPAMDALVTEEETTSQTDQVAILSDTFWRQRFNADPHVIEGRFA